MPLLYLVQAEHGYVSREGMIEISEILGLSPAQVMAVASFYTMFKRRPCGRWIVSVCTNPPCALGGGQRIADRLETQLGIRCGETTADGAITLEAVECLCICDGAPVVAINYENFTGVTPERAIEIVRGLRAGEAPPKPDQGEAPKTGPDAQTELSGLNGVRV